MEKLRQLPVHSISPSGTWETGSVCDCRSHIVDNMSLLRDWYLIKSPKAHMGKRLAVGGILSKGDQDVKNFQSAPIVQRLNAVRLRAADGLIILLIGLIDRQRTSENGFPSEALSYFQIGFPFTWDTLANVYLSSDDTCSSSGHDNDSNEVVLSVGRARRVRMVSDDEKWSKSNAASGPENDRSIQSSFGRKIEDKSGIFLKGPALHMGSNLKNFSPSDAWKRKDKGTVHKYNISSSGSALRNIQKFDGDGKIGPIDGDRCVGNSLDEVIPNQTLLDRSNSISVSMSYKNRGTQPGHECQHVDSDMEKNTAYRSSQMKGTGNKDCNILSKPPECSRDMLNATNPMENLGGGNSSVCKGPEIQNVSCPDTMYLTESGIVMPWATTFKCPPAGSVPNPVPCQPAKDSPIDSKCGVFLGNSFGERIADAAKLVIGRCTMISNSKTVENEHVEPENGSLLRSPVKRTKACQLGSSEEQSRTDVQMKSETIKVTRKYTSSVAPSTQRVTRSRARSSSFEGVEKEEGNGCSGLKDGYNEDVTIPMDCPKDVLHDEDGSTSGTSEFGIGENKDKMRLGAETNDNSHMITGLMAASSSLRRSQKERKRGRSTWQDANGEDIAVPISCSQDTFLNMDVRTSNPPESEPGKNKDKMRLDSKSFDSGQRITRSRAMSGGLRCSQKEGEGDCHIGKDACHMDVTASKSCSKSGPTNFEVEEIKNHGNLDAKTLDSDELLNLPYTIVCGAAKGKLQYSHATDLCSQHAKHLSSAVGRDQIESLVRQGSGVSDDLKESKKYSGCETVATRKKEKRKTHVLHVCRPFVPSTSAEKSSASGKALNLKMSSSGRLIVPPLAHWCNEQIVYNTEGGITCIFDGSQVIRRPDEVNAAGTRSSDMRTSSRRSERCRHPFK